MYCTNGTIDGVHRLIASCSKFVNMVYVVHRSNKLTELAFPDMDKNLYEKF